MFKKIEKYSNERGQQYALINAAYRITYKQLYTYIAYRQAELRKKYKPGERVILLVKNQMAFAIDFLCFISIGCWVAPISFQTNCDELSDLQKKMGCDIWECDESIVEQCSNDSNTKKRVDWSEAHNGGILHMTSGTTGKMKLCVRSLKSIIAEGSSYIQCFDIGQEDKIMSACPITHSFAFGGAFIPALMSGACIYIVEQFIPRMVLKAISDEKITILLMVPVIANAIVMADKKRKCDISSLRVALVGAGKIYDSLFNGFKRQYNIELSSNYGSTETGGLVSRMGGENYESIGQPMPGVEIQIRNKDGKISDRGQKGEIYVKSPAMFSGYFGETDSLFNQDGYFKMGDIGRIDQDGYVYILGRSKQLVKIGGKTVNPREIETIIMTHTKVTECVVVGKTDERNREYLKAYIAAKELDAEDMRLYLAQHLSSEKIPRVIEIVKSIKKNPVGKVDYSVL